MTSSGWVWIGAFAAASLAMVLAMVRFTQALVRPAPSAGARRGWGFAYACAWLALLSCFGRLGPPETGTRSDLFWIGVLAVSGWATFHALWVLWWSAIVRARARAGSAVDVPGDADRIRRFARNAAALGAVALSAALWNLGAPGRLLNAMFAPGRRTASLLISSSAAGFLLFMIGTVRLALSESGEMTFSVGDLRNAGRTGAWRRDARWITAFLLTSGAVLTVAGALATGFVIGDRTTRAVLGLFVALGAAQAWRGIRAARSARLQPSEPARRARLQRAKPREVCRIDEQTPAGRPVRVRLARERRHPGFPRAAKATTR